MAPNATQGTLIQARGRFAMSDPASSNFDSVLGKLVVDNGLATSEEVDECLRQQKGSLEDSDPMQRSLADLLVESGYVTSTQIERVRPKADEQRVKSSQIPGFKIIKGLGAGAMAKVYLARQLSLDRKVAIKILPKKFLTNERFVERFDAEGKAAAKLNHANIVGALDVGKAGDTPYFVMEYVEGQTVYNIIEEQGKYAEAEALDVINQMARALDHAHNAGLIHRDVKPKNIMITPEGVAKLADMGLARPMGDREAAEAEKGKAYGTPYYISPEQIRGVTDVDARADIYGLGATFYHMVTGRVPFDGPNPSAVMHKHLKEPLVPPDHLNDKLSAGVCEIIEVCMAKDRDKRYNSAADLLEDLQAVQRGDVPTQARRKFDLASLAQLEQTEGDEQAASPAQSNSHRQAPITDYPTFWLAIAGWVIVIVLILVVIFQ